MQNFFTLVIYVTVFLIRQYYPCLILCTLTDVYNITYLYSYPNTNIITVALRLLRAMLMSDELDLISTVYRMACHLKRRVLLLSLGAGTTKICMIA
jgi:hypothetical protein